VELVERSDGFLMASLGPGAYFATHGEWEIAERRAIRYARGRVLDVGCGVGRVALELEPNGLEVVGIDTSPMALEVARERGARRVHLMSLAGLDTRQRLGIFDTVIMFGNNFGLVGSAAGARRTLRRLAKLTSSDARILASSFAAPAEDDPAHLRYLAANRERGRLAGQFRIRIRHREVATRWFDYLCVDPNEMQTLAERSGWRLEQVVDGGGRLYVGVLVKAASPRSLER